MAALPPLATVEQLEDWLQVPRGSAPVPTVTLALNIASDMIRREARQTFTVRTDTLSLTVHGGRVYLPGPVSDVAEVTSRGQALDRGREWESGGDVLILFGRCPARVTVTFTHGWPVVPFEVVGLALDVAARACVNPKNLRQESTGQRSVTFASETLATSLAQVEVDKLARYRPVRSPSSSWRG
ncbi:predicted protein [Streptomyces sp. SPB78]|uniref:hypothetical protein n=1 Tax=Streptomyces sp. (strain SPB78) TaxID=591157 RepID=UPI0001B56985|nr:hypothetical protein [Streptomyces sp. SPB78]EFL01590.1 predicted protein [Streptomyces sp. SPB78]